MFSDSERHALQFVKYKPTTCTNKNLLPMASLIPFQNRCLTKKEKRNILYILQSALSDKAAESKGTCKNCLIIIPKQYWVDFIWPSNKTRQSGFAWVFFKQLTPVSLKSLCLTEEKQLLALTCQSFLLQDSLLKTQKFHNKSSNKHCGKRGGEVCVCVCV